MNKTNALQSLLNNTATEEDIALLKRLLASGEISIGGNVNNSTIVQGNGNNVQVFQLTIELLELLDGRKYLNNLDRDLTGEEIAAGLRRLEKLIPNRAPVLTPKFKAVAARLRPTLKTEFKALNESARRERLEALASVNSVCVEALDVSFNGLSLGEEAPKYDARSPFRGLESFRPEDSEFFFGREALTEKLVGKIKAHSFLAVLGASGSGKSSLVMAGVIPALDSDYVVFRPGTNPLGELESARGKALIVVDQFEELFTLTRDESAREDFIACLLDCVTRSRIILTLRSDFLAEVGAYRTLSAEIQNHLEIVPPMNVDELRRAMEGQAGVTGLRFEADLSQQILDDVAGEPGAMPLLQHALWELWNRRHGRNLRASEYRAFGGVKQAITRTAEQVYADCSKLEQDTLRDIFIRLTRLDDNDEGRDTRRRVPLNDLIPSGRDTASITLLLDRLANARLIVKTVNEEVTEVEVAHEALIRHWERLRLWLNEDRDALRLLEGVSEASKVWDDHPQNIDLLIHRGNRLKAAVAISKSPRHALNAIEQNYLTACMDFVKNEKRSRQLRLISMIGVFVVALVAVSAMATLAVTGQFSRLLYPPLPIDWVEIPAGEFLMGSSNREIEDARKACPSCDIANEQPQHLVYLDNYQVGKYEVTNKLYNQCILAGVCNRPTNSDYEKAEFENHPVTDVTWKDATIFCEWTGGRLPTEAEWEKAARGDITKPENTLAYPWGNQWDSRMANVDTGNNGAAKPIGSYSSGGDSVYGVTDMSGNVWEWVWDFYQEDYYAVSPARNPQGPEDGKYRVLRGGSFVNSDVEARSAYRGYNYVGSVSNDVGFRCVK